MSVCMYVCMYDLMHGHSFSTIDSKFRMGMRNFKIQVIGPIKKCNLIWGYLLMVKPPQKTTYLNHLSN